MMRDGRLLAEGAPAALLAQYRKNTLEDVFLALCLARARTEPEEGEDLATPTHDGVVRGGHSDSGAETPSASASASGTATPSFNVKPDSKSTLNAPLLPASAQSTPTKPKSQKKADATVVMGGDVPEPGTDADGKPLADANSTCWWRFAPRWRIAKAEMAKGFLRMRRNTGFLCTFGKVQGNGC
jgi:hypothetical protein